MSKLHYFLIGIKVGLEHMDHKNSLKIKHHGAPQKGINHAIEKNSYR